MKISQLVDKKLFSDHSGYYKTKNPIGRSADFITAPEISQIFGEVLALYLIEVSKVSESRISLIEMGAGRGVWFKDILQTINNLMQKKISLVQDFVEKTDFHIIEINPHLKKIQQQNLSDHKITWHNSFEEFIHNSEGEIYFISNELFDCFAIDQYFKTEKGWQERLVEFGDDDRLLNPSFILRSFDNKINDFVENQIGDVLSRNAPIGAVYEYSQKARDFMAQLCFAIKQRGGIAINIDYGYLSYDFANTLQAIRNHRKISFFEGMQDADITALVDFNALDKIAHSCHLNSSIVNQGQFLLSLGAKERLNNLIKLNPNQTNELESSFKRIIDIDQMGELFKVHIIWK